MGKPLLRPQAAKHVTSKAFRGWAICALTIALLLVGSATLKSAPPARGPLIHIVSWGENLTYIAARYGVGIYEIAQANRLSNPNRIYVGQQLVIPLPPDPTAPPTGDGIQHVVRVGDSLSALAVRYRSTVRAIVQANGLVNPSYIYVGQVLLIPTQTAALPTTGAYYTVRPGDTLVNIALRYGMSYWPIVQANNLPNPSLIQVGQALFIPGGVEPEGGTPTSVEGWVGTIFSTAEGSQFDDYFENPNGEQYGIDSMDERVRQQIADLRDTERIVYIWGTLHRDVPDVNGVQIEVTAIELFKEPGPAVPGPAASGPTPTPDLFKCTPPPLSKAAQPTCVEPTATPIPLGRVPLPTPRTPKPLRMDSPEYGMEVNLWGMGDCITDRDLRLVKQAGFTWVKQLFRWRDIEVHKDKFDWSEADRVVAMVAKYKLDLAIAVAYQPEWAGGGYPLNGPPRDMSDYADFMAALAQRYRGLVRAYEIWPGPNVSENWGGQGPDPKRYAEMLIDAYWFIKKQDPYAMVISGGLVQTADHDGTSIPPVLFLEAFTEVQGVDHAVDAFGAQALGFKAAPENTPDEAANAELNNYYPATRERNRVWCFRSVEDLYEASQPPSPYPKSDRQWVITQMGWRITDSGEELQYSWAGLSQDVQADYLWRAFRWAKEHWSPWVGVMFVPLTDARWTTQDDGYWWGVVEPDGCTRKAYETLTKMAK